MMRTNIFTLTVAFSISFLACGNAETQSGNKNGNNILSGTIKGVDLENLYLLDLSQPNAGPVDTAVVSEDRKSTRLNSSHVRISYAVFCLKKKNKLLKYYD